MSPVIQLIIGAAIGMIVIAIVQYVLHKSKVQKIKKRIGFNHDRFDKRH